NSLTKRHCLYSTHIIDYPKGLDQRKPTSME
ncbi:MAG: hypothetical protein ACI9FN_002137, partial [Saprospiraceae bacterium]